MVKRRSLIEYLSSICVPLFKPSNWYKFLSLAEWSYNTVVHSSTGVIPFKLMYGKSPPSIPHYLLGSSSIEVVDNLLASRQEMLLKLRNRLLKVQAAMKLQADSKRRDISYNIGDWVYVKLQPYRQSSISNLTYHKWSKRFYGAFQITEQIGAVAYRLNLPSGSKIHLVFHCSLLKLHKGPLIHNTDPLPPDSHDNHPLVQPLAILDR